MNKMSQDKLFMIILVSVFAAGVSFLGALKFSNIGATHAEGGHVASAAPEGHH